MSSTAWVNGTIITLDAAKPKASALLEKDGRILLVGDTAEVLAAAAPGTEVCDITGLTMVPGFNDNHTHLVMFGYHLMMPNLGGLDAEAIVQLLSERFPAPRHDELVSAFNWDYPACPAPHRSILDKAFPHNPVVLSQFSGHAQWLNTRALEMLGIDKNSGEPKKGQVLRDSQGYPTGIVRDLGDTLLSKRRYHKVYFDRTLREKCINAALAHFSREGVTSIQDNAWYFPEMFSLARMHRQGALPLRVSTWSLGRRPWTTTCLDLCHALGFGAKNWIENGPVKFFLDGAFSTMTACLFEPYASSAHVGMCADPDVPVDELVYLATRKRQGAFHVIGDRAISILLDAAESVAARYPGLLQQRIRLEHAQLITARDIDRIKKLGFLVAAQPVALSDPAKDRLLLGPKRALAAYPYRSLLDAGVELSFGSDIPGERLYRPLTGIHLAVNREGPEHISALEALMCYTQGSAFAQFREADKGTLARGFFADMAVLSGDPTSCDPGTLDSLRVVRTIVNGKTIGNL